MGLGAAVGAAVAIALLAHVGVAGAPWLINVALAKLGLVASGGLMAGGAATVRLAARREQASLPRGHGDDTADHSSDPR
jgi:hypothetical protein